VHSAAVQRVVILGCSGSGKTTLAVELGARLGLPIVHLDRLYFLPGWQAADTEGFLARVAEAIAAEAWISEGNYRETFALRLPRADAVIILQRSRWLCLWRVPWRATVERGRRPDLPAGCPEHVNWDLLKFIWRFPAITWPRIETARIEHGSSVPTFRLHSEREIRSFLATLPRSPP
jgi:adenylate kinase family enzyme